MVLGERDGGDRVRVKIEIDAGPLGGITIDQDILVTTPRDAETVQTVVGNALDVAVAQAKAALGAARRG